MERAYLQYMRGTQLPGNYLRAAVGTLLAICLGWIWAGEAFAQLLDQKNVEVHDSQCVFVFQADTLVTGEQTLGETPLLKEVSCPRPADQAVSIRYVPLDAHQASFLLEDYSDNVMAALIGAAPIVANNVVRKNLKSIFEDFGTKLVDSDYAYSPNTVLRINAELAPVDLWFLRSDDAPKSAIYPTFTSDLIWPDPVTADQFFMSTGWPDRFSYAYRSFGGSDSEVINDLRQLLDEPVELATELTQCLALRRYIQQEEFRSYWSNIDSLVERLYQDPKVAREVAGDFSFLTSDEAVDHVFSLAHNPSYGLLERITSEYFPPDFLLATAYISDGVEFEDGCSDASGGLVITAHMPQLRVIVAVVTAVDNTIAINGIEVSGDQRTHLRTDLQYGSSQPLQTGDLVLSREDGISFVIPLRLEFHYPDDDDAALFFNPPAIAADRMNGVLANLDTQVEFKSCNMDGCELTPAKTLATLQLEDATFGRGTYIYGEAVELDSINVEGRRVVAADAPALDLYTMFGRELGSCPFLYFEMADGSRRHHGRILVGANAKNSALVETVLVPDGAVRLHIEELEPEVSFLKRVHAILGEAGQEQILAERVQIQPQQSLTLEIPRGATSIVFDGYYVPVTGVGS